MRQPLDQMNIIPGGRFKDPLYTEHWGFVHYAADYYANYVPVYAHIDGHFYKWEWGREGGWWLYFRGIDGYTIRAAHHSTRKVKLGHYKEGTVLAITGATGTHRDGTPNSPHWHCEVINPFGQKVDPEWYFNKFNKKPMTYQNSIVRNTDDGGFFFFKGTPQYEMARQPLSPNTVGFALLTLKMVWKDKDYQHIFEMNTEEIKKYAVVWEFFGFEDREYIKNYKED